MSSELLPSLDDQVMMEEDAATNDNNITLLPEEFLEEVVAAAVADASTDTDKAAAYPSLLASPPKKKKKSSSGNVCNVLGCTTIAQNGGVCIRHGASWSKKQCSVDECTNQAINGGVCRRHGAKVKLCSVEGCNNHAKLAGMCVRHGMTKVKRCSKHGCLNQAKRRGVCIKHGANVALCQYKGCINPTWFGLCHMHGGPSEGIEFCCFEGCANCFISEELGVGVISNDDSDTDEIKLCFHNGCIMQAKDGGVCDMHSDEAYQSQPFTVPCKMKTAIDEGTQVTKKSPKRMRSDEKETANQIQNNEKKQAADAPPKKKLKYIAAIGSSSTSNAGMMSLLKDSGRAVVIPMSNKYKSNALDTNNYVDNTPRKDPTKDERHCVREGCFRYVMEKGTSYCKLHGTSRNSTCNGQTKQMSHNFEEVLLPAGTLGVVINMDAIGMCRVVKKSVEDYPLDPLDVIISLNGIKLADVQGSEEAWAKLFDTFKDSPMKLVVCRGGVGLKQNSTLEKKPSKPREHVTKPRRSDRFCISEGCSNKPTKRGFCSLHVPKVEHKRCSIEGCTRFAKGKGLCITHGATVQRKLCSVEGCKNQAKRRRLCKKHGAYDNAGDTNWIGKWKRDKPKVMGRLLES